MSVWDVSDKYVYDVTKSYENAFYDNNMIPSDIVGFAALGGLVSLAVAALYAFQVISVRPDPKQFAFTLDIADKIAVGADAFLKAEYQLLTVFVIFVAALIAIFMQNMGTMACFLVGAFLSAAAGYGGMKIATMANVRTTWACRDKETGLNEGLKVAFKSGAVMALSVVGSGLVGLSICFLIIQDSNRKVFSDGTEEPFYERIWEQLSGFAFGASSIALFARVGGGIYTKAADVGADLVGKVEEALEEDDPRNPATIADNVGDNVGDVAGMGADLFESFVGSLIASATLGYQAGLGNRGLAFPFWIAGFGCFASIIGTVAVRASKAPKLTKKEAEGLTEDMQKAKQAEKQLEHLLESIRNAIYLSSFIVIGFTALAVGIIFGWSKNSGGLELFFCVIIGLVCGNLIGYFTEYATSYTYAPTRSIGQATDTGAATVIIQGLGVGMLSTVPPVLFIAFSILGAYALSGVYGISIAAVGMLSTLGVTLATDAYGPVADNAGGLAEMAPDSEVQDHVRETTDALDALGNTTAATGKGFAIGSAVLTALALMNAFAVATELESIDILDPVVLPGLLIGALLPFVFAALTMLSVGKAAAAVMTECRDQLNKQWLAAQKGKRTELDSQKCVEICTKASLQEMTIPGVIAVFAPVITGLALGAKGVAGLLAGGISAGFLLAVTMANAGGAWDNAKKWIEKGNMGPGKGKKTANHHAAVVGDTVGDPFKDTSGPALNILIKLMSVVSLVFAPVIKDVNAPDQWWQALILAFCVFVFCAGFQYYINSKGSLFNMEEIDRETKQRRAAQGAAGSSLVETKVAAAATSEIELQPVQDDAVADEEEGESASIQIHV